MSHRPLKVEPFIKPGQQHSRQETDVAEVHCSRRSTLYTETQHDRNKNRMRKRSRFVESQWSDENERRQVLLPRRNGIMYSIWILSSYRPKAASSTSSLEYSGRSAVGKKAIGNKAHKQAHSNHLRTQLKSGWWC